MNKHIFLSKSQFIRGLQCHKSLWLYKYNPELRTPPDEGQEALFEAGKDIGALAHGLFPGGVLVEFEGSSFDEKLKKTQELIESGVKSIYEATFRHEGVLVMVDILHRGDEGWEIYEVKGSTEVKDVHLSDVAVQYHILKGSGLPLSKGSLVYINNKYVRHGEVDVNGLFAIADLTDEASKRQDSVKDELAKLRAMLSGDAPDIDIGPHCKVPYECDFMAHCWSHIPECSVFDIARLGNKQYDLYYRGIVDFKDIPEDYPLNPKQRMQVEAELTGKEFIDIGGIKEFLKTVYYPLCFLDFETINPAVPIFEGTRPYEQIPFQYSLHFIEKEGGEPRHYEFLAKEGIDPREELIKRLVSDIPPDACALAYNMGFEKGVLKNLAEEFPAYADKLMNIYDKITDLMSPFQKKYWYTKEMKGSHSIKYVLPALIPELSYKGMEIGNGGEAMSAYAPLHLIEDQKEVARIRKALLEYCKLDTLAMVRILEKMKTAGAV